MSIITLVIGFLIMPFVYVAIRVFGLISGHEHEWKEVARTYSPPVTRAVELEYGSMRSMQAIICGQTTILFKCDKVGCSKTRKEEMLGASMK